MLGRTFRRTVVETLTLSVLSTTLGITAASPAGAVTPVTCDAIDIMAHRGRMVGARFDENTVESFLHVAKVGADYGEGDVQVTADDRFVLMHDRKVNRTTDGTGLVEDLTLQEIRQLQTTNGYQVPTLYQLLKAVQPTTMNLRLETKNNLRWTDTLWQKYTDLLRRMGMAERTLLNDASRPHLEKMGEFAPDIRSSWKAYGTPTQTNIPALVDGLVPRRDVMTPTDIDNYRSWGMEVHAPLTNRSRGWQHFLDLGVDSILTDNLRRYTRWCATQ